MKALDDHVALVANNRDHLCPGVVLGVRVATRPRTEVGIDDPAKLGKQFLTFVEIDRSATTAMSPVRGCRLGKRSLGFLDYGKVTATFVNPTNRSVQGAARESTTGGNSKCKGAFCAGVAREEATANQ